MAVLIISVILQSHQSHNAVYWRTRARAESLPPKSNLMQYRLKVELMATILIIFRELT